MIYIIYVSSVRSSVCHVRDWVGCIVATFLIIFGISCISVISVYKAKVKNEVKRTKVCLIHAFLQQVSMKSFGRFDEFNFYK